jgi:hypothetical protein
MIFDRKAPAAMLGLFLYFALPLICAAQTTVYTGQAGTLWVEGDTLAWGWRQRFGHQPERGFSFGFDLGGLFSNLPWADSEALTIGVNAGFKGERLGLGLFGGIWSHSRFEGSVGGHSFFNDGGTACYAGAKTSLGIGAFTLETSFLYGRAWWQGGDFYLFLGKPAIPAAYGLGLALAYERHRLNLAGLSLDPDILSNEGERIFRGNLKGFTAAYTFLWESPRIRISAALGWVSVLGQAEGALDLSNQHSFPVLFAFFKLSGALTAHGAYTLIRAAFNPGIFRFRIDAGALQGLGGEIRGGLHYRRTNLLGGEERVSEIDAPDLGGLGAAFFLLDAGIRPGRTGRFSLGIQKALAVPWGYERFSGPAGGEFGGARMPSADFLRSVLLSGFSLYGSLAF